MVLKIQAVRKGGNVESSSSPTSLSVIRRAQELKEKEKEDRDREKTKDNESETGSGRVKLRKRPESFNLKSPTGRDRPQSWHPSHAEKIYTDKDSQHLSKTAPLTLSVTTNSLDLDTKVATSPLEDITDLKEENESSGERGSTEATQKLNSFHSVQDLHSEHKISSASEHSDTQMKSNRRSLASMPGTSYRTQMAKSSPSLNKENSEPPLSPKGPRPSIYEKLNARSGFNFSPTKQQKGPWESGPTIEPRDYGSRPYYGEHIDHGRQDSRSSSRHQDVISPSRSQHYSHNRTQNDYENLYDFHRDEASSGYHSRPNSMDYGSKTIQPPPSPPVRDASSLKYIKVSQTHEKYPSWPVKVTEPQSPTYAELETSEGRTTKSWSDNTNTSSDLPRKPQGVPRNYQPKLNAVDEKSSSVMDYQRDIDEDVLKSPKQPETKAEYIHRATVAKVQAVEGDSSRSYQDSKVDYYNYYQKYPLDNQGKQYIDKDYSIPSPPERDVGISYKAAIKRTTPEERNQDGSSTPTESRTVHDLLAHFSALEQDNRNRNSEPRRTVVKSASTSTVGSQSQTNGSLNDTQGSSSYTYIVNKRLPYYNTSTQTDSWEDSGTVTQKPKRTRSSYTKSESHLQKRTVETQVEDDLPDTPQV